MTYTKLDRNCKFCYSRRDWQATKVTFDKSGNPLYFGDIKETFKSLDDYYFKGDDWYETDILNPYYIKKPLDVKGIYEQGI